MKKFISMLTTLALVSTMFAVSAFAEEKPTLNFEVTPYTDYDELTVHNDYLEEAEEIPEGYTAYVIDYYLTNSNLSNSGTASKPNGIVMTGFTLYLKTSSAELDLIDSIVTYANESPNIDDKGYEWNSYYYNAYIGKAKGVFPKKTQDGGDVFASTVVMIPTDKSVELTFMNDVFNNGNVIFSNALDVATYESGTLAAGSQVSYKLSEETLALASDKIVLGTPAPVNPITVTTATNGATVLEYADDYTGDKTLEGMYIVMGATADANTITRDSRVVVTYNEPNSPLNKVVEYGKTIFEHLGLGDSEGTIKVQNAIKFGVVYEDARYQEEYFSFAINY